MNIKAHGIDVIDCHRLQESIDRHGQRFLERVFTDGERDYCLDRKRAIEHLAGRFAAKEAVLKVLGTGWTQGIAWTDIEVVREDSGQPRIRLDGRCKQLAEALGLRDILISITHTETQAFASAIGVGD
jgi:holo-[acyl-carrier protein] synthase